MDQHDTQLNKEKDARRRPIPPNFLPNQRRQQFVLDALPSTTTSSFATTPVTTITSTSNASSSSSSFDSTSILDPPPPYVLPRAHSSNDVNVSNFNAIINPSSGSSFRNNLGQNLNMFTSPCPPLVFSSSGSATPKAVPVSGSLLSANAHAGTSAGGASLRKTSSSVDDSILTEMRRRGLRRRNGSCSGAVDGYDGNDALRHEHATYSDGEIQDSANSDVNENYDEHLYTHTSSDNDHDYDDYTHLRPISTGLKNGTGETETEDEQSQRLSTSRKIPPLQSQPILDFISGPSPISPLSPLSRDPLKPPLLAKLSQSRFTPVLFELFRLLSIVPAGLGFIWHLWCFVCAVQSFYGRDGESLLREIGRDVAEFAEFKMAVHTPFDHFVCLLWTLLTAHQCLALTTGLQLRWRAYYPSHATLIRLLALQAICWPATQYTLIFVNHDVRPVVCWALIGSTTCFSRAVQIWVVSNLKVVRHRTSRAKGRTKYFDRDGDTDTSEKAGSIPCTNSGFIHHHSDFCDDTVTIKWVLRRWDWPLVVRTCVLPAAVVYFVMAWVGELRREVRWE